jgi:pimeloyl-ACP methyl ester carboxylesterase
MERMRKRELPGGIGSREVSTPRLRTHLLESGPQEGVPVLFVHGNVASSLFWPSMRRLALSSRRGSSDRPRRTLTTFAPLMLASIRTLGGRSLDDPVHDEFRPDTGAAI